MADKKAFYGLKLMFGVHDKPDIVDIPTNCIKYRLKQKNTEYAQIFLIYNDGIEQRCLLDNENGTYSPHMLTKSTRREITTQYPSSIGSSNE